MTFYINPDERSLPLAHVRAMGIEREVVKLGRAVCLAARPT